MQLDTQSLKNEISELVGELQSLSVGVLQKRLVSKPSTLRAICDATELDRFLRTSRIFGETVPRYENAENRISSGLFECRCSPRRRQRRRKQKFGAAFLLQETVTDKAHFPGCPFANLNQQHDNWSLGISFKMFGMIVSTSFKLSTSLPFGAGGYSLVPTFTYYPTDPSSPAHEAVVYLSNACSYLDDEKFRPVLLRGLQTLRILFASKRATPALLDGEGCTLLHVAAKGSVYRHTSQKIRPLIRFLVAAGVPPEHPADDGM